jgi:hypothetical protein
VNDRCGGGFDDFSDFGTICVEQRQRGAADRTGRRVERADVVEAADEHDRALAITVGLLDGVAQALELVGLA